MRKVAERTEELSTTPSRPLRESWETTDRDAEEPLGVIPRGSRPSSGGWDGGRLLDPAAEGVDVVPQECPVGAHDQHVDDVEADLDVAVGRVACEPGRCRDLKVASLDLAALEAPFDVLGRGNVDEDQGVVVAGDQIDLGSLGGSPTGIEELEALALDEAGGCLDCLLLKFEIAHDDLRLFVAGPFDLPCDLEAAQVLAEGKESSENPAGPEFCAAKVFRALPEEPGSERVRRSQGRRRRASRHWRFCAMNSGLLDGLPAMNANSSRRRLG